MPGAAGGVARLVGGGLAALVASEQQAKQVLESCWPELPAVVGILGASWAQVPQIHGESVVWKVWTVGGGGIGFYFSFEVVASREIVTLITLKCRFE